MSCTELRQFNNNKDESHLNSANNHAENVLIQISLLPTVTTVKDVDGIREGVTSFRKAAGQYIRYLEKEKDDLEAQIEGLRQEATEVRDQVEAQKSRVDNTVTKFQEQFSDAQSKREERSTQAQREQDQQFSKSLENIKNEASELFAAQEDSLDELLDTQRNEIDQTQKELTEKTSSLIENIESQKNKAGELLNIIANTGMVGGFQKEADSEKKSYIIWSVFAVLCFIGLILFAIWAFSGAEENGVNIAMVGSRIFAATAFGILAAYAARQADKHRKAERRNRRLQLEIAAIGPYLNDLPDEMQYEVRREIADRVFGRIESAEGDQESVPATSLYDLLKRAIDGMAGG